MANSRTLKVEIIGDAKGLQRAFKEADSAGTTFGDKLGAKFQAVQKQVLPAGAAIAGIGAGLLALSRPAERAERVLTQTIKNTGHAFKEFDGQIDQAIAKQAKFGHNSAEVQTALTNLTLKLKDPQKALDNLGLVADVASLKQISLADAANLVASALNGNARVFKQFGITLDASKPKAEAVAEAMEKLQRSVNGFAQGEASTFEGRIEGFKTRLENFAAAVGDKAGPAITGFGTALATVGGASDGIESIGNVLEKLPGKTEGIARGFGALGLAAGGTYVAVKALGALDDALETARRGTSDLTAVAAGFVDLSKGATTLDSVLGTGRIKGGVQSLVDDLAKLRKFAETPDGRTLFASFKHEVDDLDKGLAGLVNNNHAGQAAAAFKILNDSLNLTPKEKAQFFNDYAAAVENSGHKAVIAASETDTHSDALERNAEALKKVSDQVERQLTAQLAAISSTLGYEAATDAVTDAQQTLRDKTAEATQAIKEHGAKSKEAAAAQEELSDAERGLRDAAVGAASAAVRLAQDQAGAAGKAFAAADANAVFKAKLQELAAQIGGPTGEALRILAQSIKDVPGQKDVQFNILGLENAIANVARLNIAMDRAEARGATVRPRLGGPAVPERRARGGPVSAGEVFQAVEQGRELFVTGQDGYVLDHGKTERLLAGGGRGGGSGGAAVHFHFPNYVGSKRELETLMAEAWFRLAKSNGDQMRRSLGAAAS